jgi:pimeloyl-ACP methyl ester carboxylesterase
MKEKRSRTTVAPNSTRADLRAYGTPPCSIAVVHGGPGGAGGMAPVARELSRDFGVLEPLITARSMEGQIAELTQLLAVEAEAPATLIGHSNGAWLSVMVAARSPGLVAKLVLVSSAAFTAESAADIELVRRSRLSEEERLESERLGLAFESATAHEQEMIWQKYGELCIKSDSYSPVDAPNEVLPGGAAVFQAVWPEFATHRDSGQLLEMAERVLCPVVAIHGDHDPQPVMGVAQPLEMAIKDFHCVLLKHCGHTPWIERDAQAEFYAVLARELSQK